MKLRYILPILLLGALPLAAQAQIDVSINVAPPAIPVYEQPLCPDEGYLWTPGYYVYTDYGYEWVPGTWVQPPQVGYLWTPGYWGYNNGLYAFNEGYWGPTVGFYGGVNYGYGYGGYGYGGGRWEGNNFRYNTAVTRINRNVIHNTYVDRAAAKSATSGRASFNGPGGVRARPNAQQLAAARAPHASATSQQISRRNEVKRTAAQHPGKGARAGAQGVANARGQRGNPAAGGARTGSTKVQRQQATRPALQQTGGSRVGQTRGVSTRSGTAQVSQRTRGTSARVSRQQTVPRQVVSRQSRGTARPQFAPRQVVARPQGGARGGQPHAAQSRPQKPKGH